jgi:hypothetical protein
MSKLWAFCRRINWGMNLGFRGNIREQHDTRKFDHTWWEKSASIMITKSPVTKFRPWIYAVLCSPLNYGGLKQEHSTHPRPSFPARGFRTYHPFRFPETERHRIHYFTHNFVLAIDLCQLLRDFLRSIWAIVIDHNDLPFKLATQMRIGFTLEDKQPTFLWTSWPTTRQWLVNSCTRCMLEEWRCICACRKNGTIPAYCGISYFRTGSCSKQVTSSEVSDVVTSYLIIK